MKKVLRNSALALACALSLSTQVSAMEQGEGETMAAWIARCEQAHQVDMPGAAARITALTKGIGAAQAVDTAALEALITRLRGELAQAEAGTEELRVENTDLAERTAAAQHDLQTELTAAQAALAHAQRALTQSQEASAQAQADLAKLMAAYQGALAAKADVQELLAQALTAAEQLRAQLDARDTAIRQAQTQVNILGAANLADVRLDGTGRRD